LAGSGGKIEDVKRWQASLAMRPSIVMIEAFVGLAIGFLVGLRISPQIFLCAPAGQTWVVLLGVNVAAWFVLFWPTVQMFRAVEAIAVGRRIEMGLTLLVFAGLFIVPMLPRVARFISGILPAESDYSYLLIGGLVTGIPVMGIWRINVATRQLQSDGTGVDAPAHSATLYLTLGEDLQAFLWIVGVLISLGTLALGFAVQALDQVAQAVDQAGQVHAVTPCDKAAQALYRYLGGARLPNLPSRAVWAYGLYYSALLALSYGPTRVALISVGRSIRDAIVGDVPVDETKVEDWLRRRKEIGELLSLGQGPLSEFKAAVLVVSPLLASLLSTAIKASP
jgi:hypothetical protein